MKISTPTIAAGLVVLSTVVSAGYVGYNHFEKAANAQQSRGAIVARHEHDQAEMADQYKQQRIDAALSKIRDLEYDLLDETLSDPKRQWIERRIVELNATIDCIRMDTC